MISMVAGRPFSSFSPQGGIYDQYKMMAFWLKIPKEQLTVRIKARVYKMLQDGWIEEVEKLLNMGFGLDAPALKSLGYSEIIQFIKGRESQPIRRNKESLDETILQIIQKTRQFAKRQCTWFKSEKRLKTIDYSQGIQDIDEAIVRSIESEL